MQRGQWLLVIVVVALVLSFTGATNAVNPTGKYTQKGQFRFISNKLDYTGTHAGTLSVNGFKFNATALENVQYNTQFALTLNKKVSGTGSSSRTLSGQFTRSIRGVQQTLYTVSVGKANFKVNSRGAVLYNASIGGWGVAGSHYGAWYGCSMKGKKAPA